MTMIARLIAIAALAAVVLAPAAAQTPTYQGEGQCPFTATVAVSAGATTQLVALAAGKRVRVCSFSVSLSAAGTFKFVQGTGTNCGSNTADLTAAQTLATGTPLSLSGMGPPLFRTLAARALCGAAVTGNAAGWITYGQY